MYPHERSLVKQLADKPFALIGVNSDSDLDEIREIVKEKSLTWRSFQNHQDYGDISQRWGITGWPTTFVLDEKGTIRFQNVRGTAMDQAIEELLTEMGHEVNITHEQENEKSGDAIESDDTDADTAASDNDTPSDKDPASDADEKTKIDHDK